MANSKVQIANLTLTYLSANRITDFTDSSESARTVNAIYAPSLEGLLEEHPWNFATSRKTLGLLDDTPAHTYSYFFQLPSDFIRVVRINENDDPDYRVEGDRIATNESSIDLEYIKNETDVSKFSRTFVEALAARMARDMTYSVTETASLVERMEGLYKTKLRTAKMVDAQQGKPKPITKNKWINARYK